MPAQPVIELRDVDITEGQHTLVRRLSLDITPGRVLVVVSERADVRTALLRVLAGDIADYTIGGDLVMDGRELVSRVGNATQAERHVVRVTGPLEGRARVRELADPAILNRVRLAGDDDRVHSLAPADRLRAAFAQALHRDPRVIVVDVPRMPEAESLYPVYSDLVHALAREGDVTCIVGTDSLAVAADVGDDVVVLLDGHAMETGSVYDVCMRPATPYVRDLLRSTPSPHRELPDHAGFLDVTARQGCPWVLNCREEVLHACSQTFPETRRVALGHAGACHRLGADHDA